MPTDAEREALKQVAERVAMTGREYKLPNGKQMFEATLEDLDATVPTLWSSIRKDLSEGRSAKKNLRKIEKFIDKLLHYESSSLREKVHESWRIKND